MMKRFALLLAALFVTSMVLVAPVFASSNHENNNGDHNEKVCVLHKNRGDDHNKGDKDYKWVSEEGNHHGDKVVKDKYCERQQRRQRPRQQQQQQQQRRRQQRPRQRRRLVLALGRSVDERAIIVG